MPRKRLSDEEWMEIILSCKKSGLSDYRWCKENDIVVSTFYKHAKKLRASGYTSPVSATPVAEKHEVVQIALNDEMPVVEHNALHSIESPAISLYINGIRMEINNNADSRLLTNTLQALKAIC
ncbi:IS66 family insertion sequence element accessory protein TnpB [Lachnospiraceae bacterium PAL227]|uniref:IS66 family insertion sequence element accessory protein TnpB n=1 Tax=Ohessyouella blattaphilus TaxID=2949333 RepID=A0ABT1EP20_9FIRM|nr:IS66 family insertion sequence element accessory protein TnpB [Ohessyouella blattaphilus]MCP1111507.1 IS66 family insertion sequence element accessory protein TnpB [Ohessyouella blattaphilus]MCR8564901.1 IS66 family insertion sequence element accessory protein TnpB [Ohessyouella blattaphilus]